MADDRTIRVRLLAEIGSYMDGMRRAGAATGDFAKNVSGHGTAVKADVERVGRAALVMSGGMSLALGAAAKAALDWESAWAGVTKTVDASVNTSLPELEQGLRNLAKRLPATHEEIAAVAEAAGQLGVETDAILSFTEVMIALGETTNLSADQAATSIAQLMNIMQTLPGDVDNLGATLVELGNNGASTESQILEMALRLAGAGKLIGATEGEVLALANAMASLGIESQLGGGAMSRTLQKIYVAVQDGGDALEGFAEVAGVSAEEFATKWREDPIATVDLFIGGLRRVQAEGGNVVSTLDDLNIRGTQDTNVILRLVGAGDELTTSLKDQARAWDENRALQDEAAKRYGTTEAQLRVLRNQLVDVGIELGDILLPVVRQLVGAFSDVIGVFGSLPSGAQAVVLGLAGITTAALGVIGIVGTLGPKVRELDKALKAMGLGANFASQNLGRIASFALKGGLLAAGLYAVGQAIDAAFDDDTRGNITETENALLRLGQGAALASLDLDMESLGRAIERIAAPSTATQLEHVGEEIATLGGLLGKSTDDLQDAKDEVDGLDDALASLAERDPEAASAALDAIRDALGDEAFDRLLPLLDDYELALVALDTAGRSAKNGIDPVTQAAEDQEKAIRDLVEEIDDLLGRYLSVEGAVDTFWSGLNELNELMGSLREDGFQGLEDPMTSMSEDAIALREHMRGLVESGADVIRNMIEQGATQEELDRRMGELSQAFRDQAIAAGVPAPVVDHYLELLGMIPHQATTTIIADTSQATGHLLAWIQSLAGIGIEVPVTLALPRPRQADDPESYDITNPSRWGNVYEYAAGGMTPAHIAGSGTVLKYAEPETGGEAFIPRRGNRARSVGILEVAADWYGMAVVPGAAVGFHEGGLTTEEAWGGRLDFSRPEEVLPFQGPRQEGSAGAWFSGPAPQPWNDGLAGTSGETHYHMHVIQQPGEDQVSAGWRALRFHQAVERQLADK